MDVCGYGKVKVIQGHIECFGRIIHPKDTRLEPLPFFSPDAYAFISIQALGSKGTPTDQDPPNIDYPILIELFNGDPYWQELSHFFCFKNFWGQNLKNLYPQPGLIHEIFLDSLYLILDPNALSYPHVPLFIAPHWKELNDYLISDFLSTLNQVTVTSIENQETVTPPNHPKVIMVMGDKGSGKSTFLRYLTNKLLNTFEKLVFIDLDPGQSEFTFPGSLSILTLSRDNPMDFLLGPPFSHIRTTFDASFFLGSCSPGALPLDYFQGIHELQSYMNVHHKFSNIPILINTMGWLTGIKIHYYIFYFIS